MIDERSHVRAALMPLAADGLLLMALAALIGAASAADQDLPRLQLSDNGRFLVTADGKPFFWLGDTAWHMFGKSARDETASQPPVGLYFANRAAKGFTVIQSVIVRSPEGDSMANAYGFEPFDSGDWSRPRLRPGENDDYWDHVDWCITAAKRQGLYVAALPCWLDAITDDNPMVRDPQVAYRYGHFLGTRYAREPHLICATVLAIAAEQSQRGLTPRKMTFDDPAFDLIPQAQPLSDPRKANITVKQLLNHTSGITPEATGARNQGPWRHVLGHDGDPLTATLAFDPGTKCGYSTFALYHASLVCENVTGKPYDQFAIDALFRPIGVEHWTFEYFDGGGPDGDVRYGRHPSHHLGMPARDLARIAYCMLRGGRWQDKQVVPRWFVEETAAPTHDVKEPELRFHRAAESFSHGWELPARLTDGRGDGTPQDARFKPGSGGQLMAFVPSLDLVITRQTGSSGDWDYEQYLRLACDAVAE